MAKLSNGFTTITVEKGKDKQEKIVQLQANQFVLKGLEQYSLFLEKEAHYLSGKIVKEDEESLKIAYQVPANAIMLSTYLKRSDKLERLRLIQEMFWLLDEGPVIPFINPENIYINGNKVKIMHRGFERIVAPFKSSEQELLKQFKALIVYCLDPSQEFEKLVLGIKGVRNSFVNKIEGATDRSILEELIVRQITILTKNRQKNEIFVSKKYYKLWRIFAVVGTSVAIVAVIATFFLGFRTVPKKDNIISANGDYLKKDYAQVTTKLAPYKPSSLPKNTNYILATSYIHLDNLSNKQKESVLKTVTPISDDSVYKYWIAIGRSNYTQAVDIAKNIGDTQYILHAYTKLYTQVKNDPNMDGSEKQEKLDKYRNSINKYLKQLGGKANEFEKD